MKEYKEFGAETAIKAGEYLKERFNSAHRVEYKGEINLVTEADKGSEENNLNRCSFLKKW